MIQYQYHDENGNSFNLTRKCIRCKGDLTEKQAKLGIFSCDECEDWPLCRLPLRLVVLAFWPSRDLSMTGRNGVKGCGHASRCRSADSGGDIC